MADQGQQDMSSSRDALSRGRIRPLRQSISPGLQSRHLDRAHPPARDRQGVDNRNAGRAVIRRGTRVGSAGARRARRDPHRRMRFTGQRVPVGGASMVVRGFGVVARLLVGLA
jgi:hypothetical protein